MRRPVARVRQPDVHSAVRAQMERAELHRRRATVVTIGLVAMVAVAVLIATLVSLQPEAPRRTQVVQESGDAEKAVPEATADGAETRQHISIAIGGSGYEPSRVSASAASPITLTVAQGDGCAAGFLIPELGLELDNSKSPAVADLGKLSPGDYRFACAMEMVEGVLQVR